MLKAYAPSGKTWEWAHQRNRSLLQADLFCRGLQGHGYYPAVRFSRQNYFSVFRGSEGEYFFYEPSELTENTRLFQEDMDSGKCTPENLAQLSNDFFAKVNRAAKALGRVDFGATSNAELLRLFSDFCDAMTVGPIITVQLWGIESAWQPNYRLRKFLEKRLAELAKADQVFAAVETLSVTQRLMIPMQAERDFLDLCSRIQEKKDVVLAFEKNDVDVMKTALEEENLLAAVENHLTVYNWTTSEYKSKPWTLEKWFEKIRKYVLEKDCRHELEKLESNHAEALEKKKKLLAELQPPAEVMRVLSVFEELLWQRDWSKGRYSQAYLDAGPFFEQLARRMGLTREELGFHTSAEIKVFLESGETLPKNELSRRMKTCAVISLGNAFDVYSQNVNGILASEGLAGHFSTADINEVHGVPACPGKVRAVCRVVTDAKQKDEVKTGEILVTYMTTVEFTHLFSRLGGLITDEGGMSSHAAIVSREFNLPCIIGTKNATRIFKTGDVVELDAALGVARKIMH